MSNLLMIVDLEATCCDKNTIPRKDSEIIEIGSIMYDINAGEIDAFSIFIKPVIYPTLTEFCKKLTTIEQSDVDEALEFDEAFGEFCDWYGQYDFKYWGSWGGYDFNQIQREINRGDLYDMSDLQNHINLKEEFTKSFGLKTSVSLSKGLFHCGLKFEGTAHRGLDDAINIGRMVHKINLDEYYGK